MFEVQPVSLLVHNSSTVYVQPISQIDDVSN